MKKFLEEFKAFALKGNMMDMAIGVLIGGAFSTLVTSLTDNIINPIIAWIGGDANSAIAQIKVGIFPIGDLISAVINFLIVAFVVFWMVKVINGAMNRFHKKKEEEAEAAPPEPSAEEVLLTEIRDLLKEQNK